MKPIETWIEEYGESHQHPTNKLIHWICVPLIMLSLLALIGKIPFPVNEIYLFSIAGEAFHLNWAMLFLLICVLLIKSGFSIIKGISRCAIFKILSR